MLEPRTVISGVSGARGVRPGERGYNLVVLIMVITIMNILIAAMLPLWSQAIRRDKEEELVFRGLQYAEAIRIFQRRFQRPPNTLEELVELKPRSIRQLWKDPMTDDGKWQLMHQGEGTPLNTNQPPGEITPSRRQRFRANNNITPATGIDQQGHSIGPITGVYTRSKKKSILIWNGRDEYDEWRFTVDLVGGARQTNFQGAGVPVNPAGGLHPPSARWIGRPMRTFGGGSKNGLPPSGPLSMPGAPGQPPPPPPPPPKKH